MQSQVQDDFLGNVINIGDRLSTVELSAVNDAVPIGALIAWPFSSNLLPSNWLVSQGQAIDRVTYGALFSLTNNGSAPFGVGDGATTFNLPNYPNALGGIATWTGVAYSANYGDYAGGFGGIQYWKDPNGIVHLQGLLTKSTAIVAGETMFTLPAGYRPSGFNHIFNLHGSLNGITGPWRVDVPTTGAVAAPVSSSTGGPYLSFAGVIFDSASLPTQDTTLATIAIKAA